MSSEDFERLQANREAFWLIGRRSGLGDGALVGFFLGVVVTAACFAVGSYFIR
jgi:hypothetical protein